MQWYVYALTVLQESELNKYGFRIYMYIEKEIKPPIYRILQQYHPHYDGTFSFYSKLVGG